MGCGAAALLAQDEEAGEFHGRSGARFHLAYHGSLVLVKDFSAAARGEPAGFEIHQEIDFPWREAIAVESSAEEFGEQAPEANELALALFDIICRGHSQIIGRMGAEL